MGWLRRVAVLLAVYGASAGLGVLSAPGAAECRQCNSKTCFHDADCGRLCTCIFPGGKSGERGTCAQLGD